MRLKALGVTLIILCLASLGVLPLTHADDPGGGAKDKLVAALTATAKGQCPADIMSPLLLDACETQLSTNQKMLSGLGKIQSATYRGKQELPNKIVAEAYRVEFEKGTMTWLASLDGEGKLLVLWTSGDIRRK